MTDSEIKKTASDLIYLVACAVNDVQPDKDKCSCMDLDKLAVFAGFHSLSFAAAYSLKKIGELPRAFDQAEKKAIRKLALFDIERAKILRTFDEKGIWYLPLKGIVLGDCYPKRAMREMNDNDILCDSSRMDDVREIMTALGYTCESFGDENHDIYSKKPTIDFEMHRTLFFENVFPQYKEYFDDVFDRLVKDEGSDFGYHMTCEDMYLYMICHMHKHYVAAGTGLRSLLDICLYNRRYYSTLDKDHLALELEKLGLSNFEKDMRILADKVFNGGELTDVEREKLDYLIRSGNNGNTDNAVSNRIDRLLGGDDSKAAKRKLILKRVFISGEVLKQRFPLVYKHKALYPFLLVFRPIRGAFTHPKGVIREYKAIKSHKKNNL